MTTLKAKVDGAWVTVGGVGVGVPAGGATNAILAKSSAADYATAWTTTPILTDLSIVDATTPTMILQRTGGSPPIAWYTQIDAGGSFVIGASTDPALSGVGITSARDVFIGRDLYVSGNTYLTGTLTSKHAVRAAGLFNYTDGALIRGFGIASGTRVGVGDYRVNLAAATIGQPQLSATLWSMHGFIYANQESGSVLMVKTANTAGAAVDAYYSLVLIDGP